MVLTSDCSAGAVITKSSHKFLALLKPSESDKNSVLNTGAYLAQAVIQITTRQSFDTGHAPTTPNNQFLEVYQQNRAKYRGCKNRIHIYEKES